MGTGPISPEGWALTVVFGVITTVAKRRGLARQQLQVLLGTFSVIVALKGTSPGGPRKRQAFDLERRRTVAPGEAAEGA